MTTKTPGPGQTAYTDPEGWYTFNYPAAWKPGDHPNSLAGVDGFVESGYLPEMGYMGWAGDVCTWLANLKPGMKVTISYFEKDGDNCMLNYPSWDQPNYRMEIIENPEANPAQRFVYFKVNAEHYDLIRKSFTWIQPVSNIYKQFDYRSMPLRFGDSSFWEKALAAPLPNGISLQESAVIEADRSDYLDGELDLPIIDAVQYWESLTPDPEWVTDQLEVINDQIGSYGYSLERGNGYSLYRDNELLLENIYQLPDVQFFKTPEGTQLIFLVYSLANPRLLELSSYNVRIFMIRNDEIIFWNNPEDIYFDPDLPPIYCNGEILLLLDLVDPKNDRAQALVVMDSQQVEKFRYIGAIGNVENFQCWRDQWVIDLRGFVIQDGQILNQVYDYEEIFGWHLIKDQPFFFFRKGPRLGIQYGSLALPVYYDEIYNPYPRPGYPDYYVPQFDGRSARFFANGMGSGTP